MLFQASVAQLVEHFTRNEGVTRSSRARSSIKNNKGRIMGQKVVDENEPRVPVFGFRSGKSYKMVIAVLYYAIAGFILVTSVIHEFRY